MKKKPQTAGWKKELKNLMCGYDMPHGTDFDRLVEFISQLLRQERKELVGWVCGELGDIMVAMVDAEELNELN